MLRRHFLSGGTRHFYWIDIFCHPQEDSAACIANRAKSSEQSFLPLVAGVLQRVGRCVLATDAPGTSGWLCARRWCVTELLLAQSVGCAIDVALTFGAVGALADGAPGTRTEPGADGR